MNHFSIFSQIFAVTAPIFSLVLIGVLLKRFRLLSEPFIQGASMLVYKATLPVLLGLATYRANIPAVLDSPLFIYYVFANLVIVLLSGVVAWRLIRSDQRAVFIQGGFRGNHGIIALALVMSLYGDEGLQIAGLMSGLAGILNNSISVLVFSIFSTRYRPTWLNVLREVMLNPMIIGVLIGAALSLMALELPLWLEETADLFGSMSVPLALLCIGATLSIKAFKSTGWLATHATLMKLIWVPLIFTALGGYWGIKGMELGTLFLFLAVPTASASYVLAKISGDDATLAANIIVLSTFFSMVTVTLGLYVLQLLMLI